MIQLKGDHLEGGGQIVRTALALSTITGKEFEVNNIRKGRDQPGLKNQHLFCVKALQDLCNAEVKGAELGSEYIYYKPGKIKGSTISIDIGTAGSITLLLQSLLLPCMFADKKVRLKIKGGTDTKWSMPVDYFIEVLMPHLKKYVDIDFKLEQRGYYPAGNGRVDIKINPKYKLSDFNGFNEFLEHITKETAKITLLEQGHLLHIKGVSHASIDLQKAEVAERQAKTSRLLLNILSCPINIRTEYVSTDSTGSGITLWAIFSKDKEEIDFNNPIMLGADSLGEKGKRSEEVGKEAGERLIKEINYKAPVDEYLADNLIPFLALFGGQIKVGKISNHTLTNIYTCEQFLGKIFDVDKNNNIISVKNQ